MGTWDAKERAQFKIDAENLKADIDAIQSEKLKMVQDELGKVEAEFLNFKTDIFKEMTNHNHNEKDQFDFVFSRIQFVLGKIELLQLQLEKEKSYNLKIFVGFSILFLITAIKLLGDL